MSLFGATGASANARFSRFAMGAGIGTRAQSKSGEARSCHKLCRVGASFASRVWQARSKLFAMKMSNEKQRLGVAAMLLGWCGALIFFRLHRGGDGLAVGLLWNLFLAAVPLVWSWAFRAAMARHQTLWATVCFALWLLFLPNAPYLLTDLIHLSPRPHVPLWFILAMLLSCAGTGTFLGYFSLWDVHAVVEAKFGKVAGWLVAGGSLMLCGFGIYLGRFLRWNSWDIFTRPKPLLRAILGQFVDAGPHPHPVPVTLVFGGGLLLGYFALRVMALSMPTPK